MRVDADAWYLGLETVLRAQAPESEPMLATELGYQDSILYVRDVCGPDRHYDWFGGTWSDDGIAVGPNFSRTDTRSPKD